MTQAAYRLAPFSEPLSVPKALASRRNWIGWKAVPEPGKPKPKKLPICIRTGSPDGYTLPENHVSYGEATAAMERLKLSGVGFVMTPDCGLIGVDMDGCRDPATGVIEPRAQAIIDRRETYFEISPSGEGVRFWALTDVPLRESVVSKAAGVEMYSTGRYLTFTGDRIVGTPLEVGRAPYAIETLMRRAADAKAAGALAAPVSGGGPGGAQAPDLDEAFRRKVYQASPMGKINQAALGRLGEWVPELFPAASHQPGTGAWRVKSVDLGRGLEEDLSLSPEGIVDFGVHDLGDPREGKRTPIDVVMEWSDTKPRMDAAEAAEWLAAKLGLPFDSGSGSSPGPDAGTVQRPPPDLEVFDAGDEKGDIEPREWLLGTTFCRGYLSGLVSAGGSGKTTVRILQLLSCATGRALSGEHVFVRSRVMIVCLEDDMKELRRRVLAARLHHSVSASEVKGWLFLTTPRRLKVAELDGRGKTVVAGGLYHALVKAVDEKNLDLVCIDPAIKAHGLDESSNPEIDAFATLLADLAADKNIGMDLLAHERKGLAGQGKTVGDAERGRGASALKDAQRLAKTLTGMNEKEAEESGVPDADRRFYVRIDDAKVNIAPPSASTAWMKIVGVNLGNGNPAYPSGDNVQTCETWTPTAGVFKANVVQATLWDAQSQGRRVRRGGQGSSHVDRAATILGDMLGWSPQQAKKAVAKLIEDKLAVVKTEKDEKGHDVVFLEIEEPQDQSPF